MPTRAAARGVTNHLDLNARREGWIRASRIEKRWQRLRRHRALEAGALWTRI